MSLGVCLLAAEVAPLSKTGGLADVAAALAKYLTGAGHEVRLFTPLYASIDRARFPVQAVDELQHLPLQVGPHHYVFSVGTTRLPGSQALVYLIDCPVLYGRPLIYTTDPDEHLRFLAFTRAVLAACQRLRWPPQILHCNDWHTAFGPLFVKAQLADDPLFARTRSVLTIHNIGYQGIFPSAAIADLESVRRATCCTRTICARAKSTRCATEFCTRTRSPRSVPHTPARSARISTGWACRTRCACAGTR